MLKTRAQYVPWSPRQPLQTLNSTRAQACKGRLCTSTLTEPVQLATYFKNGNAVAGGSSQAHARRWACPQSRSPRVNGGRSWFEGPAGPGDVRSLETTTVRARYGHGDNNFCVVGCRTTPWYGAAGIAQHPSLHDARNSRLRPCFAEKLHLVTKNKPTNPVDCAPSNFVRSVLRDDTSRPILTFFFSR